MSKKAANKQSPSCSGRWCETHLFSIRPLYISLSSPHQDSLRFCPKLNKDKNVFERATPKLNLDMKHYTPAFILQEDERLYVDHDRSNLRNFQQNIISAQEEISEMMIPKVSIPNPYCRVCRQYYEDYMQHTASARHCERLARNPYSLYIAELADYFKTSRCKQTVNLKQALPSHIGKSNQSQLNEKETCVRVKENCNEKSLL